VDASDAVDTYLLQTYRLGLEQVLSDITAGRLPIYLADAVQYAAKRIDRSVDEDGGVSEMFEGTLTVEGIEYRFRCATFVDRAGGRFVSDVGEFVPVEWRARLVVPKAVGERRT
jgi:hypothetical protein